MTIKRIFGSLIAATCLVFALCGVAVAAPAWEVTYTDSGMSSNFSSAEIQDVVSQLQPGDETSFSVALNNRASASAAFYMTNSVLKTLEETSKAQNGKGAYEYVLTYTAPDGTSRVLFNSDTVGGEGGHGMYDATDAMGEWFHLDDLKSNTSGSVSLKVGLDGETQGNMYMSTLGQLQLNFAADKDTTKDNPGHWLAKTGDMLGIGVFGLVALAAAAALMLLALLSLRKDQAKEEQE